MQAVQKRTEVLENSEKVCTIPNQRVRATWDDKSMEVQGLVFLEPPGAVTVRIF